MASGSQNLTTYLAKGLEKLITTNAFNTDNLLYINTTDTNITADMLGATTSIAFTRANITGAYTTGHIVWLNAANIGTPFQLVVHDSSDLYLYKRWKSSGTWTAWIKMRAGTADTWTTARTLTIGLTGKSVDGSADVSWNLNEIMGASDNTKFWRGDKVWSNTLYNTLYIHRDTTDWKTGAQLQFSVTKDNTSGYSYIAAYQTPTATTYNQSLVIAATGSCFIGGGEGAETIHQLRADASGTEDLFLCPDGSIRIYTGADSKTQRAVIDSTPSFYPATTNTGNLGTSSYRWASLYSGTGNFTGDVTVAAGKRVGASGGALYLGNSGNQNWVYVQDMCSQDGQKWKIHQSGAAEFNGTVTAPTFSGNATSATYLKDRTNSTATYANYGAAGLAASAISWLTCWNGYELRAISKAETMAAVRGAANGSWAISVTGSSASCTGNSNTANYQNCVATNEIRYARNGNMSSANSLWQGWAFAEGRVAVINDWRFGNGNGGLAPIYGSKVYNAVWNDFAEYRVSDITEGGRVLVSDGKGHLILSTERLQPSARVISDTFGCSVGMSDSAKTPIGVAGRVLVYPYQPRENYKVGDALCAAPNGTADIMTREEIIQYPDRIIGIVDEVPDYKIWDQVHTNKKDDGEVGEQNHTNIEVKGRIWIYVR